MKLNKKFWGRAAGKKYIYKQSKAIEFMESFDRPAVRVGSPKQKTKVEPAPDPRNVRDSLLEAGYSYEEVEKMLNANK